MPCVCIGHTVVVNRVHRTVVSRLMVVGYFVIARPRMVLRLMM